MSAARATVATDPASTTQPSAATADEVAVVLGPRTRLGAAILAGLGGVPAYAVARDERDAEALRSDAADATVWGVDDADIAVPTASRVCVYVCALGPVHPDHPDFEAEVAGVRRDLGFLDRLLDRAAPGSVRVVLVSTVIALAPGEDRRHYGGWKCLVEQEIRDRLDRHRAADGLSVVYPGRLVEKAAKPTHRLHTRYDRLARLVTRAGHGAPVSRVVGLDARLWLIARGLTLTLRSLSGTGGSRRSRAPQSLYPPLGSQDKDA